MKSTYLVIAFLATFLTSDALPITSTGQNCAVCEIIVDIVRDTMTNPDFDNWIEPFVVFMCAALKIQDNFVCQGFVSANKDEFIWIMSQYLKNPIEICGIFVSDCDYSFQPNNATWTLPMPGIKPLHQEIPDPDEKEAIKMPAGKWGTVAGASGVVKCDLPYWTLINMLEHIVATHNDIDYILVSGDLESHATYDYTFESHEFIAKNISNTLRSYFPDKNIYFAIGNHEGIPVDNFAPHFTPERFHMDPLYTVMADSWEGWVPDDQRDSIIYNGCYVKQLFPGLRLISLNNGFGDYHNFFLYLNQTDPDGTMTWLIDQLAMAEYAGDKVQILAHMPGTDNMALEGWAINYYNAVNRFEDTIVGQFFGHTHYATYCMTYEDPEDYKSRPTSVIYSAPSVTTISNYNPGYRLWTIEGNYSGSNFQIIDFEEWMLNLTVANENPDQPPQWEAMFLSAKEEYEMPSLKPTYWNQLIDRMLTNDTLLQQFLRNYYRISDRDCDMDCKNSILCHLRQAHHSDNLCSDFMPPQKQAYAEKFPNFKSKNEAIEYVEDIKKKLLKNHKN
uniref:Sphingomyelin phosphodiesterase n=1 Tax=Acrobeloides nanus TaxID=290746 RepID=A0A914BW26_9BILA